MFDAEGGDQNIDGLTYHDTILSERSIVLCCFDSQLFTDKIMVFKGLHELSAFRMIFGIAQALKKLGDDQIPGDDPRVL